MAKQKCIVATGHAIVSEGPGVPARTLAPGEFIVLDEDNETHKQIVREINSSRETNLEIQERDVDEGAVGALETSTVDDVLQAPARALEQEVREAPFENEKDASPPKEAKEGAKEIEESVEAEQQRQLEERGDVEESSSKSGRRGGRRS